MIDDALMDADELDGLDGLLRRVDPDRWLSSRFIADPVTREDVLAIYAYDHELARAPRVASNPLLGEIRLTWWREALDEMFEGRTVRAHPTAQALADVVRRHKLARGPLETMIDARYRELDTTPMSENELLDWARDTGGLAAQLAAQILDPATDAKLALAGGAAWALGKRLADRPELRPTFLRVIHAARGASHALSVAAFPAVAHAALAGRPSKNDFSRRLRLTVAVARGKI
ncbi:MAG: squalene/phytoene synthase family protein [Phenylobacterium sp.]